MVLPQAHHILLPSQLPTESLCTIFPYNKMGNYDFSADLSCKERRVPYSQEKTKEQKKMNVKLRAEEQDNILCSVH